MRDTCVYLTTLSVITYRIKMVDRVLVVIMASDNITLLHSISLYYVTTVPNG